MRTADEMKMHSIAFPAIGTGNLGYHRNEVAKIMFDVVEEYKQRIPNGSLQRVCFVIFEEDIDSLRVNINLFTHCNTPLPAKQRLRWYIEIH